ncbi:MAG TPA: alkaline phosphatase family protein [Bryobacterales bacterium]|nr:alkaline phosphatase family protein [Bryobacterales bacterium]
MPCPLPEQMHIPDKATRTPRHLFARGIAAVCLLTLLVHINCGGPVTGDVGKRIIVLGIDGMDPKFLERHWDQLPNLDRLRREGDFKPLTTTIPPQSPVAWSSVITGLDAGGHGIYDFVHRNPFSRLPFSSMAETSEAGSTLDIGDWVIPLSSAEVKQSRRGDAFWPHLTDAGVPAGIIRMPANFPPVGEGSRSLSGMGTPDMHGTYGEFTFYTDDPERKSENVSGGEIVRLPAFRHNIELEIKGPVNSFLKDQPVTTVPLTVNRDPSEPVVRFDLAGESFILKEGEWSGWLRASFPLIGDLQSASGIFRVYLRQVRPRFELYVTPINIDPTSPALPISTPASYSAALAEAIGLFYTQGMAEDTSAYRQGTLTLDEFMVQSRGVLEETRAMLRYELSQFKSGLLFFYISSVDQNAHMLWGRHDDKLLEIYRETDKMVGEAMELIDDQTTLIVMSDHGFERFDRAVNLNTLLLRTGFLALDDPRNTGKDELFQHVDWSRTRAYAMGINSIYINRLGREEGGIVAEGEEFDQTIAELRKALLAFRDPDNGEQVIEELYESEKVFKALPTEFAPDLIVGYRPPYRTSWETGLGGVPAQTVVDNDDAWIGDHCIAPQYVPGVLLSNRKIALGDPGLTDVPVTLLREFGVEVPSEMIGRPLF